MTFWAWADEHIVAFFLLAALSILVFEGFTVNVLKVIAARSKKP